MTIVTVDFIILLIKNSIEELNDGSYMEEKNEKFAIVHGFFGCSDSGFCKNLRRTEP